MNTMQKRMETTNKRIWAPKCYKIQMEFLVKALQKTIQIKEFTSKMPQIVKETTPKPPKKTVIKQQKQ